MPPSMEAYQVHRSTGVMIGEGTPREKTTRWETVWIVHGPEADPTLFRRLPYAVTWARVLDGLTTSNDSRYYPGQASGHVRRPSGEEGRHQQPRHRAVDRHQHRHHCRHHEVDGHAQSSVEIIHVEPRQDVGHQFAGRGSQTGPGGGVVAQLQEPRIRGHEMNPENDSQPE